MDKRYEVYCLADRHFYETPNLLSSPAEAPTAWFATAQRTVPEGWRGARVGDWLHIAPSDEEVRGGRQWPKQGWKIHVSATLDNADRTAATVWDYCVPRVVPFKFVPGRAMLHLRNSKYANRGSSGKFATVYPRDEQEFHTILRELGALLEGGTGPYILTDLRWGDGPLHVRYGGFAERFCVNDEGVLVPAIEDGEGRLVPDLREPAFHVPEWVTLPAFLEPHLAARNATTVTDLPYRIERALHFSNGGGVYAGEDARTGARIVLKEGRPHAGLAADGADAVARLEREKTALERLSGLGVAPEVRDWFTLGDHRFLVMDHLEGKPLNSFFAKRHPLLVPDPDPDAVADYTKWALRIHHAVEEAVHAVHERGVVFNDLHMFNIMVRPDEESVALLDFEAAGHVDEGLPQVVAHPGFIAPADRRGFAVDHYALACLRLALFVPMTSLLVVDRDKAAHLADVIAGEFPVPRDFLDEAVATIRGADGATASPVLMGEPPAGAPGPGGDGPGSGAARPTPPREAPFVPAQPGDWPRSRDSMARAILASATPGRDDRLFPGDVAQFSDGGGLGIAHGAAGVLHALAETGAGRYEEGERWLLRHTDPPPAGTPLGLYDGLLGVALVLDRLGHRERALDLTGRVLGEQWQRLTSDLFGGLAGAGLALEHLSRTTGETELRAKALEAARVVAERLESGQAGPRRRAGLLHGATGPALLFLRLYERTGHDLLLDLAAKALHRDLDGCVEDSRGTWMVDEGRRTMPYLGAGSVGIAMVLDDYLAHRHDERFVAMREGILPAACSRYYAQPGLFDGRAGMVLHLSRTTAPGAEPRHLADQVAAMAWYAMPYQGHLAFPGEQMMRLSMDLNTGTAGCLLALGAALGPEPAHLPFLPPLAAAHKPAPNSRGAVGNPSPQGKESRS
jgi:Protein kinase domain/Lanthionine synthetase C-like protein